MDGADKTITNEQDTADDPASSTSIIMRLSFGQEVAVRADFNSDRAGGDANILKTSFGITLLFLE